MLVGEKNYEKKTYLFKSDEYSLKLFSHDNSAHLLGFVSYDNLAFNLLHSCD